MTARSISSWWSRTALDVVEVRLARECSNPRVDHVRRDQPSAMRDLHPRDDVRASDGIGSRIAPEATLAEHNASRYAPVDDPQLP